MPNWVTNNILFDCTNSKYTPEDIAKRVHGKTEDGRELVFDFNRITPMPECLNIEASSRGEDGYRAYMKFLEESKGKSERQKARLEEMYRTSVGDESWLLGMSYHANKRLTGSANWYDWCCNNWGTKWNACDAYMEDPFPGERYLHVSFQTAWSAPRGLIQKLSKILSGVTVEHEWSDEDIGSNVGSVKLRDGKVVDFNLPESGTKDAYELAFEIQGIDDPKEEYGLVFSETTGTYEWKEA